MMTLAEIVSDAYGTAKEKGWVGDGRTVGDHIALMHSELSEALEEYRSPAGIPLEEIWHGTKDGKPEGVAAELADVVIRIAQFCQEFNVPLEEAVIEKLAYNKTRPFRHGGKVI